MKKNKNIYLLETDKPSRLHLLLADLIITKEYKNAICNTEAHIYITSDEEIKVGDWYIYNHTITKRMSINDCSNGSEFKKIILTTDQDLIKDGVKAIDDNFLQWFLNNPSCDFIEVELEFIQTPDNLKDGFYYKIIIPQEKTDQELLNEAKRYAENWEDITGLDWYNMTPVEVCEIDFLSGANFQADRMYSEEEVLKILEKWNLHLTELELYYLYNDEYPDDSPTYMEWFEQFKKSKNK